MSHQSSFSSSPSTLLSHQLFPFDSADSFDSNAKDASSLSLALDECVMPMIRLFVRQPWVVSRVLLLAQYNPRRSLASATVERARRASQHYVEAEQAEPSSLPSQQERLKEAETYLLYSGVPSSSDAVGTLPTASGAKTDGLGYITQASEPGTGNSIDMDLSAVANPLSRLFYLGSRPGGSNLRLLWRGFWLSSVYQMSRSFLLSQLTLLMLERDETGLFVADETSGSMTLDFASLLRLSFCHIAVHWALAPFDRAVTRQIVYSSPSSSSSSFELDVNWYRDVKLNLLYHSLYPLCRYAPFIVFEPTVLLKWSFHCLYYLVSMPIETLLVRSHVQEKSMGASHDVARQGVVRLRKLHYPSSIFASLSTIVHEEGVTSLYRGLGWRLVSLSVHLLSEWIRDLEFDDEE